MICLAALGLARLEDTELEVDLKYGTRALYDLLREKRPISVQGGLLWSGFYCSR